MKVIFFVSSKGGCGKSFVIKNLSEALGIEDKVLISELSDRCRYLDLLFGITDSILYDICDYSSSDISLDDCIANINENIDIICSPLGYKPLDVKFCLEKITKEAEEKYDYLLIDVGNNLYIDIIKDCICDCEFVLVNDSSFMSVRGAESLLSEIGDRHKASLVINRVNSYRIDKGYDNGVDEILDILKAPLLGVVYDFSGGFDNCMNFINKTEKELSEKIFESIAKRLKGENVPVTDYKSSIIKKLFG